MITIEEQIVPEWARLAAGDDEAVVKLLLATSAEPADVLRAVREAVLEVQDRYELDHAGVAEPPFAGEWDWARVADGVLVQVIECHRLDRVLPMVAAALERRGIAGTFALWTPAEVAVPPIVAHFIGCRVRVRGTREHRGEGSYIWNADPDTHAAVLAIAERWCKRAGPAAQYALQAGTVDPVPPTPREDRRRSHAREACRRHARHVDGRDRRWVSQRVRARTSRERVAGRRR